MNLIDTLEPRTLLDAVAVSLLGPLDLANAPSVPGSTVRIPLRAEVRNLTSDNRLSTQVRFFAVPANNPAADPIPLSKLINVSSIAPEGLKRVELRTFRLPQDLPAGEYRFGVVVDPDRRLNPEGTSNVDLSTSTFLINYRFSSLTPSANFRLDNTPVRVTFRGPGNAELTRNEPSGTYDLTIRNTQLGTRLTLSVGAASAKIRNVSSNTPLGLLDLRRAPVGGTITLNGGTHLFLPSLTLPTPQSVILGGTYRNLTLGNLDRVNFVVSAEINLLRLGNVNDVTFLSTRSVSRLIVGNISNSNIRLIGESSQLGRFSSRSFSNTRITTPTLGGASLGRTTIAEVGRTYGVAADAGGRVSGAGFRPYTLGSAVPFQKLDFGIGNRSTFAF